MTFSEKLVFTVIPNLEFCSTTLADALEFLRQRSIDQDADNPSLLLRGVPIVCPLPDHLLRERRVSFSANECTLQGILWTLAQQTGLQLVVNGTGACLLPPRFVEPSLIPGLLPTLRTEHGLARLRIWAFRCRMVLWRVQARLGI